jgi:hypothetical protein
VHPLSKKGAPDFQKGCTRFFTTKFQAKSYNMKEFIICPYGFKELALLYFPSNLPASASSQLRRRINLPPLIGQLKEASWYPGQKILTPRQVEIIIRHIGEP